VTTARAHAPAPAPPHRRRKARIVLTALVGAALAALLYLQVREWTTFDWAVFLRQTRRADFALIALGVVLIYVTFVLRAVRWRLLLKPAVAVPASRLISPTIIGFTGLALLGRAGEFVRPYRIARREGLTVSSQMAVWWVERIFDAGSFALLLALNLLFAPALRRLDYFEHLRAMGLFFVALVLSMTAGSLLMRFAGHRIARAIERLGAGFAPRAGRHLAASARSFSEGLHTIHDFRTFFYLIALSLTIWLLIASAYLWVLRAYPAPLSEMTPGGVTLLIGMGIAGSVISLPAIGGGPQLLTIAALVHLFHIPPEMAVSAGILIWLVAFMSVVPAGLLLARHEHVSIRRLSEESLPQDDD
jgi:uncharacterized protein (TIRG00374 family)